MSERLSQDIELLVDLFKAGNWDELRIEYQGVTILLSNDLSTPSIGAGGFAESASPPIAVAAPQAVATPARPASGAADPNWAAVVAPNLGTFYRSPKPGAAPFVEIGQRVEADTEICLLEVMKLFTSVKAGFAGTVRRVSANDAELVEGGQVLFYIDPE